MWFVPVITAVGDGIEWEINVDESAMAVQQPQTQKANGRIPHDDQLPVGDNMV